MVISLLLFARRHFCPVFVGIHFSMFLETTSRTSLSKSRGQSFSGNKKANEMVPLASKLTNEKIKVRMFLGKSKRQNAAPYHTRMLGHSTIFPLCPSFRLCLLSPPPTSGIVHSPHLFLQSYIYFVLLTSLVYSWGGLRAAQFKLESGAKSAANILYHINKKFNFKMSYPYIFQSWIAHKQKRLLLFALLRLETLRNK